MTETERYVGLMSGTSLDGVDAVLVRFGPEGGLALEAARTLPMPGPLRAALERAIGEGRIALAELGRLDAELGALFA
ncbi:MAG TPA: anhydro-N-acetylmuramic acid kinase, partial [Chromatiales bacterium]|nr:anhydro-N-acetylmuramic acid kinase [Chromatiales bacterium]